MEYETNTSITETHVQTDIRWDPGYVKTVPGILKGVAVVRIKENYEFEALFFLLRY